MVTGLTGIGCGAVIAGASSGVVMFGAGLFVLAITKIVFDVGLGSWIADHVPYERRGRVVGVTETAWALGLLIGVSLMGLITAATSWRWGYAAAAVAVVVMAGVLARAHRLRRRRLVAAPAGGRRSERPPRPARVARRDRDVLPDVGDAGAVRHVRTVARGRVRRADRGPGGGDVRAGCTRARRLDDVGRPHRPLGQGAERRRRGGGDGAGRARPRRARLASGDRSAPPRPVHRRLRVRHRLVHPDRRRSHPRLAGEGAQHDDRVRHARAGADRDPGDPALRPLGAHARRPARRRLRRGGRRGDVRPPPRRSIGDVVSLDSRS